MFGCDANMLAPYTASVPVAIASDADETKTCWNKLLAAHFVDRSVLRLALFHSWLRLGGYGGASTGAVLNAKLELPESMSRHLSGAIANRLEVVSGLLFSLDLVAKVSPPALVVSHSSTTQWLLL